MTRAKAVLTDLKPARLPPFACLSVCGLGKAIKVAAPSHVSLSFHFCQALSGFLMCRGYSFYSSKISLLNFCWSNAHTKSCSQCQACKAAGFLQLFPTKASTFHHQSHRFLWILTLYSQNLLQFSILIVLVPDTIIIILCLFISLLRALMALQGFSAHVLIQP